jgi:hypothetical protein
MMRIDAERAADTKATEALAPGGFQAVISGGNVLLAGEAAAQPATLLRETIAPSTYAAACIPTPVLAYADTLAPGGFQAVVSGSNALLAGEASLSANRGEYCWHRTNDIVHEERMWPATLLF